LLKRLNSYHSGLWMTAAASSLGRCFKGPLQRQLLDAATTLETGSLYQSVADGRGTGSRLPHPCMIRWHTIERRVQSCDGGWNSSFQSCCSPFWCN
jgi:hypothetical protein